jgi:uncharacterized damage-inducible protein DinB
MGKQVDQLIDLLRVSLFETLEVLSHLSEAELDELSEHPCAMGGTIQDLLTHNIDHEKMHTGQVYSLRYSLKRMQKGRADRLMAETLRARADLIASLIGLPDDALTARSPDDEWTIQEVIEHTIYWERHSMNDLIQTRLKNRLSPEQLHFSLDVQDPIYGQLPLPADEQVES